MGFLSISIYADSDTINLVEQLRQFEFIELKGNYHRWRGKMMEEELPMGQSHLETPTGRSLADDALRNPDTEGLLLHLASGGTLQGQLRGRGLLLGNRDIPREFIEIDTHIDRLIGYLRSKGLSFDLEISGS